MMRRTTVARARQWCLAAVCLWTGAAAHAEFRTRVTVASDYLHRGLEHSQSSPVYQAALEYQAAGGWFAGVWASTVSFDGYDGRTTEVDYYAGYGRRLSADLALELSAVRYTFQGRSPRDDDWSELQLTAYLRQRWTVTFGVADHWWATPARSRFVETTYRHPLPWLFTLDATGGYQLARRAAGLDYGYAEAGISRRFRDLVLRAGYSAVESAARDRFLQFAGNPERGGCPRTQRPLNTGCRFSTNAFAASR